MKKVAVVGFGFMGKTHAMNILKNKDLQLVAIVDKTIEAIDEGLQSKTDVFFTGIDRNLINKISRYSDFDDCLNSEQLESVHICVHTNLHFEMTKKALNHGLHVLLEKPFCLDISKGDELIRLSKEKGLLLMVAHVVRFMPPYQKLKKWIHDKTYGDLKFLSLKRFSGTPKWGEWKEKQENSGVSGGALFDLLVHDIDFATYVMRGTPDSIKSNIFPGRLSKHDYINAIWDYTAKNVTVVIEGGNVFHSDFPFQAGFQAQFDKASICYSSLKPEHIFVADDYHSEELPAGDLDDGYANEINYFYTCMVNNTEPVECTVESSLETIRICTIHST